MNRLRCVLATLLPLGICMQLAAAEPPLEPAVNTSALPPAATPAPAPVPVAAPVPLTAPAPPAATAAPASGKPAVPAKAPATSAKAGTPAARGGKAQDRLQLDATQITGNSELPRVLYVVPWKRSDLGDLTGRPVNSLLDEVLAPVDRDVFRRQNRYYEALRPDAASGGSGRAAAEVEK
jgi:hypothetical protein